MKDSELNPDISIENNGKKKSKLIASIYGALCGLVVLGAILSSFFDKKNDDIEFSVVNVKDDDLIKRVNEQFGLKTESIFFDNVNNIYFTKSEGQLFVFKEMNSDLIIGVDSIVSKNQNNLFEKYELVSSPATSAVKPKESLVQEIAIVKENSLSDKDAAKLVDDVRYQPLSDLNQEIQRLKNEKVLVDRSSSNNSLAAENQSIETNVPKDTVDPQQMQISESKIMYKDTKITKINFDKEGFRLSDVEVKEKVKGIFNKVESLGNKWAFVYPAKGEEKHSIVVFTDVTCPVCKKLHTNIKKLNSEGVTVRYLMYPRAMALGIKDPQAQTAIRTFEKAWCSKNPNENLDKVFSRRNLEEADCSIPEQQGRVKFPVNEHYMLGNLFELEGTPMMFSRDGKVITGFSTVEDLIEELSM